MSYDAVESTNVQSKTAQGSAQRTTGKAGIKENNTTLKTTIETLHAALSPLYDRQETKAIIRLLLEEVCGLSYTDILMHRDDWVLPPEQAALLRGYAVRLAAGEPVQQVMGYATFRGRRFEVDRSVLIPRPETEQLVQLVVDDFAKRPVENSVDISRNNPVDSPLDNAVDNPVEKAMDNFQSEAPAGGGAQECHPLDNPVDNPVCKAIDKSVDISVDNPVQTPAFRLLDIGTGSGCIAVSLALEINNVLITALDFSTSALEVARKNAKALSAKNICFVQADILKEENEDFSTELSTYHAIVSNPPYICRREAAQMSVNVLDYEPPTALFVPDSDPLLFYRAIAKCALRRLESCGKLYFEINEAYGPDVCHLLEGLGYQQVTLHRDFFGKDRFVTGVKVDCAKKVLNKTDKQ